MLCIDTSSLIAYLSGAEGPDVNLIDRAFSDAVGVLAPVTLSEMLSDPTLSPTLRQTLLQLPLLPIMEGYWERAGLLRAKILRLGRKAKMADTFIAQSCLDHDAVLVTRDEDFAIFTQECGLKILAASS